MYLRKCVWIIFFNTICFGYHHKTAIPLQHTTIKIMLDPAGDAKHTGRSIQDNYERGLTLQFCEQLKIIIENRYPFVQVIITRTPGEIIPFLQNAHFANRLHVFLFLNILFFHTTEAKPPVYLYQFTYNANDIRPKIIDFAFYTYDQSYLFNFDISKQYATIIYETGKQPLFDSLFTIDLPRAFPFKPLMGVTTPAVGIEMGLRNAHDWQTYLEPIVQSIHTLLQKEHYIQ